MKQTQKKGLVCGLALVSLLSATTVMAEDKVVVIPMGSSASKLIYTVPTDNLFVGENVGNRTMTGDFNTGVGSYILQNNTTGSSNSAFGRRTLEKNTNGDYNTAVGYLSLYSNTTGGYNTAVGVQALYAGTASTPNTGNRNTAVGYVSLYSNTTGSYNTAVGLNSLHDNTTGYANVATGTEALQHNTTGYDNTASGRYAGDVITTGHSNTFIGAYANAEAGDTDMSNSTAIGNGAIVTTSNDVRIGNDDVNWIGGAVGWTNLSDVRAKKDIQNITKGLDFIKALRPVEYRMIKDDEGGLNFGFIAQDIEALLGTDYNVLGVGGDPDRTLSLRYTDFIAPMVKAMQEQQEIIEEQKKVNEEQEKTLADMRSELDELKAEIKAIRAGR